jgi:Heparinase II/III-like protein/Heparinase II/III N-terminus
MSPAEVASRSADVGRHILLRSTLSQIISRSKNGVSDAAIRSVKAPKSSGDLPQVSEELRTRIVDYANQWLQHRGRFFALRDLPLGEKINWHRDYASGVVCPLQYSGSINHRDLNLAGDMKYTWELNRLQHLILLELAAIWEGNELYQKEVDEQLTSWCMENPFMQGINWKSPMEAGLRLISWALLSFLRKGTRFRGLRDLGEIAYQHQYFIRKFYSKHSSANNHLIGEMSGLYVGTVFWPSFKESERWRSFARRKLIEEIFRQVGEDGVDKERATEYQLFALEFFLLAGTLGQAIGDPFPKSYWKRIEGMMDFLTAISDGSGNLPLFGDGDSGQVVWLPETTVERCRSLIDLSQTSSGNRSLRSYLLLWGQSREAIPLNRQEKSPCCLKPFPQGGYYVISSEHNGSNRMKVIFDAAPFGLGPLFAHGHADALSFWLSYGGREFFIDPGTFCYYTHPAWRTYFRGTSAHNTVRVDGQDQSVAVGPFLWRHVGHGRAERKEENDELVEVAGIQDGYQRLPDPVIHRRSLRLYKKSNTLLISDRLECRSNHEVEVFFHLNENCEIAEVRAGTFRISNQGKHLKLRFLRGDLKTQLYRGSENPICGWVSRTFDVKQPCFTLVARTKVTGSTDLQTEIAPS